MKPKLTDNELNEYIALRAGFTWAVSKEVFDYRGSQVEEPSRKTRFILKTEHLDGSRYIAATGKELISRPWLMGYDIKDYCNDLNEMREAENFLTPEQCYKYREVLSESRAKEPKEGAAYWSWHAGARESAEAFYQVT